MKYTLLSLFFVFSMFQTFSQGLSIQGMVQSAADESTFPGATIILLNPVDSTTITGSVTDINGKFQLNNIKPGNYIVKVQFIGFAPLSQSVDLQQNVDLGTLLLQEEATALEEVTIVGKISTGEQKGDTSSFNAEAFKTLQDASAQELVEKIPGINMQDGKIQAQGEDVQQILIDGKPFFGNDVKAALQNLPAEVIAQIQVFDKKSEKAELSGFDDGQRIKTINIVTKPNRKKGQFGKSSAGYGSDQRYQVGTSTNFFNNERRITVTGLSNNINVLDYSADPNSQGESRTQDGIITTNTLGLNFTDEWGKKLELSGSYLYSQRENDGNASLTRDYMLASDSGQVYTEDNYATRKNMDHRLNMRVVYNIDSNNRLVVRPVLSLKHDKNTSYFLGRTVTDNGPLNQTENTSNSTNNDYDFDNSMYYNHRFRKKGRNVTLGLNTGFHKNENNGKRIANNVFYRSENGDETLNQDIKLRRTGFSWDARVSYTEPIGKKSQVELEYMASNRLDDSDKLTYNIYEEEGMPYSVVDTALSNTFNSEYLAQEAEVGYQYANEKLRFQVEAEFQRADLKNDQEFPQPFDMQRTFKSVLPTVRLGYKFTPSKNLQVDYDTWTNAPSIGQLQGVIDNSNPLHIRTGNPELDQAVSNRIRARYRANNPENDQSFFVYVASSFIKNNITNSSIIAEEPTAVGEGIMLERGSQFSQPVNLNGYWDFRSYVSYGKPVDAIKSNINVSESVNYTRRPGMINDKVSFVNSSNFRVRLSLSSNISEKVDFNISTAATYNIVENSLNPALNNNYFNQTTRLRYNWIIWQGLVYRTDLNYQVNTGLEESYDNSYLLLNMSLGKKFLKNQRAELSVNVYDLLKQNNNIRRNVSELYVEDVQSNVLQRYFMLTFTYNLRHFNKGTSMSDFETL